MISSPEGVGVRTGVARSGVDFSAGFGAGAGGFTCVRLGATGVSRRTLGADRSGVGVCQTTGKAGTRMTGVRVGVRFVGGTCELLAPFVGEGAALLAGALSGAVAWAGRVSGAVSPDTKARNTA